MARGPKRVASRTPDLVVLDLVLPRVMSLLLLLPLLYIYACLAGLLGGMVVGGGMLQLAPQAYLDRTAIVLSWNHLGLGLVKCIAFGALIGIVGCYCGLHAKRNAAGVGQATTQAVVASIVGVIVLDSLFAILANALGV